MTNGARAVPPSAVRRLTKYLAIVQQLQADGIEWVSSKDLSEALGLTSSTVRQDLSHLDFAGVSKRGYQVGGLARALAAVLGADKTWNLAVVGAGNMGRALATHEEFSRRGFVIRGLFDADEKKIGRKLGNLTIRGMRDLPLCVQKDRIDLGVIAVPAHAAQAVADLLVVSGVRGLLNLALTHVIAPARVQVVDARLVASLQELTHAIRSSAS
jgi:redox-sensing transcriptional repressor